MNIKDYSKKRLYSIIRTSIIGISNIKIFDYLLDVYFKENELKYNDLLLKIFDLSKEEYKDFMSFENYPREVSSFKPSFYTLNRKDMCNIIKNVLVKLHDRETMRILKQKKLDLEMLNSDKQYIENKIILDLYVLRLTEYNEIINFEESLMLYGTKDNGLDDLNLETRKLINKLLIKV